jgi:serine/threonine-protein kinase
LADEHTVVGARRGVEQPEMIGPYRIEQQLGQGGMGRIYRAADPDGRAVALKVIRPEHAADPTFRRRFAREARAAQAVKHPHVVPVLASGEHEGTAYLATAYIDGGSLDRRLAREGPLELEAAVRLCLHVASGLAALHRQGLVHRDVKPANILLDATGSAFVTDFGLAKSRDASALTRPGFAVGSLHYMAPEQARAEELGPPADVYGLGCVLYECLAGRPPFAGRHGMDILEAHVRETPGDPFSERTDGNSELGWTVLSALAKDPAERPPTTSAYARMVQVAAGVPPLSPGR